MESLKNRFLSARREVISRDFAHLNDPQREATLTTEGPLLLLAGAGSGKTTALIHRIANLVTYGRGSDSAEMPTGVTEDDVRFLENFPKEPSEAERARARDLCAVEPAEPWRILAITFTNKAANELKERLRKMVGAMAEDIWACTFHKACVRILRRDIDLLGYSKDFTIYDTDDSKRVIKDVIKSLDLDEKAFAPRQVLSRISNAKDRMQSPAEYAAQHPNDYLHERVARIYAAYDARLHDANALDFDDIILKTVELLRKSPDTLSYYQDKFRYILVDEYQDTNHMQYELTSLLAGKRKNICVVGDDDQSIYKFRGANIENILSFEKNYPGARTIRLEQNYRSTQHILDAANAVIRNNTERKGKTLWTKAERGEPVQVKTVYNEQDEANGVATDILTRYGRDRAWSDFAVLYRMNAQSNALEMAFRRNGIPYKVYGGLKFFDRAEVKDMLSYLAVIQNPEDDLRLRRIINTPPRGIGPTTVERLQELAVKYRSPLYAILQNVERFPELKASAPRLTSFIQMMDRLRALNASLPIDELYDELCRTSGYVAMLEEKKDLESQGRLENIEELKSNIVAFQSGGTEDPTLAGFLNEVALFTDLDEGNGGESTVSLMTVHSAKGLEFPVVYMVGMEEGIFPGNTDENEEEMQEERRLCYVGMTRAKKELILYNARLRMLFGRTKPEEPSRFLGEIPEENCVRSGQQTPQFGVSGGYYFDDNPYGERGGFGGYGEERRGDRYTSKRQETPPPTRRRKVTVAPKPLPMQLAVGDRVRHKAFGEGSVTAVRPMSGDAMLTIAFEAGEKKLMLRYAAAQMEKL